MFFDKPLASCTNNIIYIDCPNNYKTRVEVVCTILCFLKITSTHHTTILRLCHFHLSYRGKSDKKVVSNTRSIIVFRRIFLLLFFRDAWAENRRRRIPAVSGIKLKFTEHAQQNTPLLHSRRRNNLFPRTLGYFQSLVPQLLNVFCCWTWSFISCRFWRGSQGLQTRRVCVEIELLWLLDLVCLECFILILAVEVGQILSLTLTVNVDVGSDLICWILHHDGFHIRDHSKLKLPRIHNKVLRKIFMTASIGTLLECKESLHLLRRH